MRIIRERIDVLAAEQRTTFAGSLAARGRVALDGYALYTDAEGDFDLEVWVVPVLRSLASSRARVTLVIESVAPDFSASRLRRHIHAARAAGVASLVDMRGQWTRPQLELLFAARPSFARVGRELVLGVAGDPRRLRQVGTLVQFARRTGVPLVACGFGSVSDLDAVRGVGITLAQLGHPQSSTDVRWLRRLSLAQEGESAPQR